MAKNSFFSGLLSKRFIKRTISLLSKRCLLVFSTTRSYRGVSRRSMKSLSSDLHSTPNCSRILKLSWTSLFCKVCPYYLTFSVYPLFRSERKPYYSSGYIYPSPSRPTSISTFTLILFLEFFIRFLWRNLRNLTVF